MLRLNLPKYLIDSIKFFKNLLPRNKGNIMNKFGKTTRSIVSRTKTSHHHVQRDVKQFQITIITDHEAKHVDNNYYNLLLT